MIVSGQMTRDEALEELSEPLYDEALMNDWMNYISRKLGVSREEFDMICEQPAHQHTDYKVEDDTIGYKLLQLAIKIKAWKK